MFVSGWKWNTKKIMIPSQGLSRKIPIEKEKKGERKKEKKYGQNANQTERSHVRHNVKILPH